MGVYYVLILSGLHRSSSCMKPLLSRGHCPINSPRTSCSTSPQIREALSVAAYRLKCAHVQRSDVLQSNLRSKDTRSCWCSIIFIPEAAASTAAPTEYRGGMTSSPAARKPAMTHSVETRDGGPPPSKLVVCHESYPNSLVTDLRTFVCSSTPVGSLRIHHCWAELVAGR